jgi:uncharacterized protein YjeT (DUF2065 family)
VQAIAFKDFLVAFGLLFVIEGLLLAGIPGWIRGAMESLIKTPDSVLRITGLVSAVGGLILIWLIRRYA